MNNDVLQQLGPGYLGSRLKRLGERMQAGAAQVTAKAGLPMQPSHMPVLAALDDATLGIGELVAVVGISQPGITRCVRQLVEMGLVQSQACDDQRRRAVSLTDAGKAALARASLVVVPALEEALCAVSPDRLTAFMQQIDALEAALTEVPLAQRAAQARPQVLTLREYDDSLADTFRDINLEWIRDMFEVEASDTASLDDPRKIVDAGGVIVFVEARGLGIVGTGALIRMGNAVELTKLGVRQSARGLKAGAFLLDALLAHAKALNPDPLFLLTNEKCAAAVHLYEKAGFQHDADIMARYGAEYARCNVAMRYAPDNTSSPAAGPIAKAKTDESA